MGPSTIASWVLLIHRYLQASGLDVERLFRHAGLRVPAYPDPAARYPLGGVQKLWWLAAEETGNACLGVEVGALWHPTTFHALGYAALASASLREALDCLARYSHVVSSGAHIHFEAAGETTIISLAARLHEHGYRGVASAAAVQAGLASMTVLCRCICHERFRLKEVRLSQRRPAQAARMEAFFGCPVLFGGRENALCIPSAELEERLATANPALMVANLDLVQRYVRTINTSNTAERVRAAITRSLPSGRAALADIARAMNTSLRTLQRRLETEGLSYRALLDETRRTLAEEYERDPTLSRSEIAYLLGFTDAGTYSRSSRRWRREGAAPAGTQKAAAGSR